MPQFTLEQSNLAAEQFHNLASAVFQQRMGLIRSGLALNDPQIIQLQSRQIDLVRISNHFALEAASLTLNDVQFAADEISTALSQTANALATLQRVDTVISIASAAINFSIAVYSSNLDQIATAAQTLIQASHNPPASQPQS